MAEWRDALGRAVALPAPPRRVVSLCPSITETVAQLAPSRLVGRTRWCIHPASAQAEVAACGGTKNPDLDAIRALQPDLVLAEKEENRREDVEALAASLPVYVFDVLDVDGALDMLDTLGALLAREAQAAAMRARIARAWAALPRAAGTPVLYLIWRRPWMAAGAQTYIDAVLRRLGLCNVAAALPGRYPELDAATLATLEPHRVLLSSEPYPFAAKHEAEVQALFPRAHIERVDGEAFSWYGARMRPAADYLAGWLSP